MEYYVVCIERGRHGREAIVDPDYTLNDALQTVRDALSDNKEVSFVHRIRLGELPEDLTEELIETAHSAMLQAAE